MRIEDFIRTQTNELRSAGIASARLDVLVLLGDALQQDKAWLLAHGDEQLNPKLLQHLCKQIARRMQREPLSYIRGRQEFYGRDFVVNSSVLVPRPETETVVEQVLALPLPPHFVALDVGTGSGVIAITLKLERPDAAVYAIDKLMEPLETARDNARRLHADVVFAQSDLLQRCPIKQVNVVLANLPYVNRTWQRSPETAFEPATALFADDGGLALIQTLITQVGSILCTGGYLALEADPLQHDKIIQHAQQHELTHLSSRDYALVFQSA